MALYTPHGREVQFVGLITRYTNGNALVVVRQPGATQEEIILLSRLKADDGWTERLASLEALLASEQDRSRATP